MSCNTLSLGYEGGEGEQAKLDKSQTNVKPDIQLEFFVPSKTVILVEKLLSFPILYELNMKFVSESH